MLSHLNVVTICCGVVIANIHMGGLPMMWIGSLAIAAECYRAHRIHKMTSHVPRETVRAFYRGDLARKYLGVKSTVQEILKFAESNEVACGNPT